MNKIILVIFAFALFLAPAVHALDNNTTANNTTSVIYVSNTTEFLAVLNLTNYTLSLYSQCQANLTSLNSQLAEIKIGLDKAESKIGDLPAMQAKLDNLTADVARCREQINSVNENSNQVSSELILAQGDRDRYKTALDSSFPKWAVLVGFFLGVALTYAYLEKKRPQHQIARMGSFNPVVKP